MSILRVIGLALVAGMFLTFRAPAQEKKIKRSDLPPAVEKVVAQQSQGATIRGFSEEKENGPNPVRSRAGGQRVVAQPEMEKRRSPLV